MAEVSADSRDEIIFTTYDAFGRECTRTSRGENFMELAHSAVVKHLSSVAERCRTNARYSPEESQS